MFCVECGKEGIIYKSGVCLSCYLQSTSFTKGPAILDIVTCPRCNAYKVKNTWVQEPFDAVLRRLCKDAFTISPELVAPQVSTECKEQERILSCLITFTGTVGGQAVLEQHPLTVRLRHTTCDVCSREAGGYYEAIIQIRADHRTFSPRELEDLERFVTTQVDAVRKQGKRTVYITDYEIKKEGLDFFLSDRGFALSIARRLQEQRGGEFKQSASNVGMKDSRQLYRMTYLVRLPRFLAGDIVSLHRIPHRVVAVRGQKVRLCSLPTWEESVVGLKVMAQASPLTEHTSEKEMIVVSQTKTELQLMDPQTYQIVTVPKPKRHTVATEKVTVLRIGDTTYLPPVCE